MPRGAHGADPVLFGPSALCSLRAAVDDLSWLLSRGYAPASSLKLVGDRHRLRKRQRMAVARCACAQGALSDRLGRRVSLRDVTGRSVAIDGFNALIAVETALAGGVVLRGRDGALRDLASVHGSYRRVAVTEQAIALLAETLAALRPAQVTWYLDRPVSNSGRLAQWLREAAPPDIAWAVELPFDPDAVLIEAGDAVVVTSDSMILDACGPWADLVGGLVGDRVPQAWIVDLGSNAG